MSRSITSELEAHFGEDLTTVALCFDITRTDAEVFAFTTHDRTITYDGIDYDPFSAASFTNLEQVASTEADNLEVGIAFDDDYITKEDIQKGKFDHAFVRLFMINYNNTTQGIVKLVSGYLGDIDVNEFGANAEMMSIANLLKTELGEVFSYKCRADFGDSRCGLVKASYQVNGTVTGVTSTKIFTDSSLGQADHYFKYGTIEFSTGNNAGLTREVKDFGSGQITCLFDFPYTVQVGDTFVATPGCSGTPADCKTKFASNNIVNFRGEPHLPGRDEASQYPDANS